MYYCVAQKFYSVLEQWHIELRELGTEVITDKCQAHEYTVCTLHLGIFNARLAVTVCM